MTFATGLVAGAALTPMAAAIQALYRMGSAVNEFIDNHIAELKASANQTIASTGRVLEGAKFGFGIGFLSYMVIVATGQLLLGNQLGAVIVVTTAPVNPIAMSCAAVGAIYYGWSALSLREQEAIVDRVSRGLELGLELVRSLISFVIRTLKDLMSSKRLVEFKQYIESQAALFGKSLYSVTHQIADLVTGVAKAAKGRIEKAANKVAHQLGEAGAEMKGRVNRAIDRRRSEAKRIAAPEADKPAAADSVARPDEPLSRERSTERGEGQP